MRVLVVDAAPEASLAEWRALREEGFAVDVIRGCPGNDCPARGESARFVDYDVVLLHLLPPGMEHCPCQLLREAGRETGIVILSPASTVEDRVRGLDAGADDYLPKPFAIEELSARLRALSRRRRGLHLGELAAGPLRLDPARRLVWRDEKRMELTQKEYALLEYLMQRRSTVLTRSMLAQHVWDGSIDRTSNVIDVYVARLRAKIDEPGRPSLIQTVRGAGYMLRDAEP